MSRAPSPPETESLLAALEEAQALLDQAPGDLALSPAAPRSLPSLLEACEAAIASRPDPVALRSVHHFAATGGTLMCKALALMPNVTLLSEMDPLSDQRLPSHPDQQPDFWPTDPIYAARVSLRPVSPETSCAVFTASVARLQADVTASGGWLVLRDHAHSQFCSRQDFENRPTLYEMLRGLGPVVSLVTVRHPLDSWLSLQANKWVHFSPPTPEDYARRYHAFLDRHAELPIIRYEDFVADPEPVMQKMCSVLALPFRSGFESRLVAVRMTGDSGRSGARIAPRPRREIPGPVWDDIAQGARFQSLCARLGYALDPPGGSA